MAMIATIQLTEAIGLPTNLTTLDILSGVVVVVALFAIAALVVVVRFGLTLQVQPHLTSGSERDRLLGVLRRDGYLIAVLGLVIIGSGGLLLVRTAHRMEHYQLLLKLGYRQTALVSEAHTWLEEALEGDLSVDVQRQVSDRLHTALQECETALEASAPILGTAPPNRDAALRQQIAAGCHWIDRLTVIAAERLRDPSRSGAGTPIDAEFDATYSRVIDAIQGIQADLEPQAQYTRAQALYGSLALLFLLMLTTGAATRVVLAARRTIASDFADLQRLAAIVRTSGEAIFTIRGDGTILDWNASAERVYGYNADQAIGQPIWRLVPPELLELRRRFVERIRETGTAGFLETEDLKQDGERIDVSLAIAPVTGTSGSFTSFSVIARDVTEQKRAEAELRAANERYALVARATHDVIWDWDVATRTTQCVEGIGSTFGYSQAEARPEFAWWSDRVHPDDLPELIRKVETALAGTAPSLHAEYRFRRADGSYADVLYRGYIQRDRQGAAVRLIGAMTDISARKETEKALIQAKDEAERASRLKSEFLSRMSHELRTPLNSVIGFASVLSKNEQGNLQAQDLLYVERISANGQHLLQLINDILDLARVESGKMKLLIAPVALDHLVQDVVGELQGTVREKPLVLSTELAGSLGVLHTDAMRLRQILINIIGNAIKFTPSGSVQVRIAADTRTHQPTRIDVSDTGVGIPPDRLEAIFRPFEQAEGGTTRRYGGTGLGLSISKSLAEMLGYRIEVQSQPGVGSTFSIILSPEPGAPNSGSVPVEFGSSALRAVANGAGYSPSPVQPPVGAASLKS